MQPPNNNYSKSFGTTKLGHRSRTPSPESPKSFPARRVRTVMQAIDRLRGRRLPPTPSRAPIVSQQSVEEVEFPTLSQSPTVKTSNNLLLSNINFPKLNASPTHYVHPMVSG